LGFGAGGARLPIFGHVSRAVGERRIGAEYALVNVTPAPAPDWPWVRERFFIQPQSYRVARKPPWVMRQRNATSCRKRRYAKA
jgi:hypothetical protein